MGRLVIRYYPVDGEYSAAPLNYGSFGIALWLQPKASYYDWQTPTMGAPGADISGVMVAREPDDYWNPRHASIVAMPLPPTIVPGEYVEQEVYLLETDSSTIRPVSLASLPLEVIVACEFENPPSAGEPWTSGGQESGYAGGAVEVGLYEGDEYHSLTVFWIDGNFFQAKEDGTSWEVEGLPAQTGTLARNEATKQVRATLKTVTPWVPFWTQLLRATEIGSGQAPEPDPEPEPADEWGPHPAVLVAGTDPEYGAVGFGPGYGSLTPATFSVGPGKTIELNYFDWQEEGLYTGSPDAQDVVTVRVDGLPGGTVHLQPDTYLPGAAELIDGSTYHLTLTFVTGIAPP